jgi:hypothetical protein
MSLKLFTMIPLFAIRPIFMSLILLLIVTPVSQQRKPDEFQLCDFILQFKGMQFLTGGMCTSFFGVMEYFWCNASETCHIKSPGNSSAWSVRFNIVEVILNVVLVWIAFYHLNHNAVKHGADEFVIEGGKKEEENVQQKRLPPGTANSSPAAMMPKSSFMDARGTLGNDSMAGKSEIVLPPRSPADFSTSSLLSTPSVVPGSVSVLGKASMLVTKNSFYGRSTHGSGVPLLPNDSSSANHLSSASVVTCASTATGAHNSVVHPDGIKDDQHAPAHAWWERQKGKFPTIRRFLKSSAKAVQEVWTATTGDEMEQVAINQQSTRESGIEASKKEEGIQTEKRNNKLKFLLSYDLWCLAISVCFLFALKLIRVSRIYFYTNKFETVYEENGWLFFFDHFCGAIAWGQELYVAKLFYSLSSVPFFFFVVPGLNKILMHTIPTGYNKNGIVLRSDAVDEECLKVWSGHFLRGINKNGKCSILVAVSK